MLDDFQNSTRNTSLPPSHANVVMLLYCVYVQSEWFQWLSTLFGGGEGGLPKIHNNSTSKHMATGYRTQMYTANAFFETATQLCLNTITIGFKQLRRHVTFGSVLTLLIQNNNGCCLIQCGEVFWERWKATDWRAEKLPVQSWPKFLSLLEQPNRGVIGLIRSLVHIISPSMHSAVWYFFSVT